MKLLLPRYTGERLICEVTPAISELQTEEEERAGCWKGALAPRTSSGRRWRKRGVYFIERSWFDLFTGLSPVRINLKACAFKRNK